MTKSQTQTSNVNGSSNNKSTDRTVRVKHQTYLALAELGNVSNSFDEVIQGLLTAASSASKNQKQEGSTANKS